MGMEYDCRATLFDQLKNWPVKLASYFMQMSFRVSDLNFNWLLHFSTFLFRGSLHSMFRKLTNVEMLNLKIGAETQDKIDIITVEKERLS